MATATQPRTERFPSPFEVETPPGAEGWRNMYPPYLLFSDENREFEDSAFWIWDSMHLPEVQLPFETHTHENWIYCASVANSRIFAVPPSFGFTQRMLNGYEYVALSPVNDPKEIEARVPVFMARAGQYYQNWNPLFEEWKTKAVKLINDMAALEVVQQLPHLESDAFFQAHPGANSGQFLLKAYDTLMQMDITAWTYHFEMLNIGYAAYLNLFMFCRQAFPGITDQTLAHMLSGTETMYMRPDAELRKLARLAIDLGVSDSVASQGDPLQTIQSLGNDAKGREWIEALQAVRHPWFNLSTGNGLYHHHASWNDDLRVPFKAMTGYINRLQRGESIERPVKEINDRKERITAEYRGLLQSDEDRQAFDQNLGLAKTVATFIEDHAFIIHDWYHTVEWNKIREFGLLLTNSHMIDTVDDMFYLNRWEVPQALFEAVSSWASVTPSRGGKGYWKRFVNERKGIVEALRQWTPPPALGPAPSEAQMNDPIMLMLYGLTPERVDGWLGKGTGKANELRGVAASSGQATGTARVVRSVNELSQVQEGEILVAPMTEPAWSPIFSTIKAAVSDIGGIMSHSAIISREYGLPAVTGTGNGTTRIKTGDTITVDGTNGVVTIEGQ
jgi:pyruvate,water dikinase